MLSKHISCDRLSYVIIIFMAKKPTKVVKLQLKAGQANPAPPVGTALGPTGIQIAEFCKQFNDKTKDQMGKILPTVINIYEDRSFDFYTKQPPMTWWIKDALKLASGSKEAHKTKVGHLTMAQLKRNLDTSRPESRTDWRCWIRLSCLELEFDDFSRFFSHKNNDYITQPVTRDMFREHDPIRENQEVTPRKINVEARVL
jgi:large subunit ribosomal protein L11